MIRSFSLRRYPFRWSLIVAVAAVLAGVLLYESYNVRIETDILASLPRVAPKALRVGFAAESTLAEAEAARKLTAKGAHLLVANDISRSDIGFGAEQNEVTIFGHGAAPETISRRPKAALASALFDRFETALADFLVLREAHRETGSGRN